MKHDFERGVEKVRCAVKSCGKFTAVCKTAFELLFRARFAECLVLFERLVVARSIEGEALFFGEFCRHLDGEAVRVVKSERRLAGEHRHTLRKVSHYLVKLFETLFDGLCKLVSLRFEFGHDSALVLLDVRIRFLIFCDVEFCKFHKSAVVDAESTAISHCSADKTTEHVALVDVGRRHCFDISEEEGCRARMVCDYAHCDGVLLLLTVLLSAQFFEFFDCETEQIRLVHRLVSVEYAKHSFKSHTLVDVLLRKR